MDWKKIKSKFSGEMTKEKWILLLAAGVLLMILSFPPVSGDKEEKAGENQLWQSGQESGEGEGGNSHIPVKNPGSVPLWEGAEGSLEESAVWQAGASPQGNHSYEKELEERIREILRSVEGVGKVEVMVVLKSSSEKILHTDRQESVSSTKETDSSGGKRQIENSQTGENTVLSGSGDGQQPIVEKELSPELSGIVISAQGGGDPSVKSEISQAMEALFGLPVHKIKVLKRVE